MQIIYTGTHPAPDDQCTTHAPDNPERLNPEYRIPTAGSHSTEGQVINHGSSALHAPDSSLLFQTARYSSLRNLVVGSRTPCSIRTCHQIATHRIALINREHSGRRNQMEGQDKQAHLDISKVQFGVWYWQPDSLSNQRSFSIEYERDFLRNGVAKIHLVYEDSLVCIDIIPQANEKMTYFIRVKFSTIRNLGTGYDQFGQPFILFDLHTPPTFEVQGTDNRAPDGTVHKYKFRDRISSLDDVHARIAPYAHHMRVLLATREDLLKFEEICKIGQVNCHPVRVSRVDALPRGLFSNRHILDVHRWIKTMDYKNAFQIEACLRHGLLNTHGLLSTLQRPIEKVIRDYGDDASELLRLFAVALRMRNMDELSSTCLVRVRAEHPVQVVKPFKPPQGRFLCHHIVFTPTRVLLHGPYTTQSNRVIRHYQNHDPTLVDRFVHVNFRDEDNLGFCWDGDVDGSWFLRHRVGDILRNGFELGGRTFEFLAYSMSDLHDHAAWFVAPFRDPLEGYVNAEIIRASFGDFSAFRRTPSRYAAGIAQVFTETEPSVRIRRDQWEEQDDLGPHTDGAGTISPELADMIWDEICRVAGNLCENRVKPSAYQFSFLGYRGVVVVDHRLEGIKMRLRKSQHQFPVYGDGTGKFEIVRSFDHPDPAHLNRPLIMALEDLGVDKSALIYLQNAVKAHVSTAINSLEGLIGLLKSYSIGGSFHLASVLDKLSRLGLGPRDTFEKRAFENAFIGRLLGGSAHHIRRELKYKARIPVPGSYQLVGVADEGQGYIREGFDPDKVFTLKEGFIYVCVQESVDKEPVFLKGPCLICRNPVIHPGDVQRVYAVGIPPKDKICFFRNLKNVVVLPAVGNRSLASHLGGGDLSGDTYDIYFGNSALLPTVRTGPANYPPNKVWTLDEERDDATADDIRNFFIEFMISNASGLLTDRHMVIADQSKDGVFDARCLRLAKLYRTAIDYATNGIAIEIDNELPKPYIKSKPDWDRPEVPSTCQLHYYKSNRALGHLFRNIDLHAPNELSDGIPIMSPGEIKPLEDAISRTLAPLVQTTLSTATGSIRIENTRIEDLHARYASEMRFICTTHGISTLPDACLTEEGVVLGTILAKCRQPRWHADRADCMRLHTETLVRDLRVQIVATSPLLEDEELRRGLQDAWAMWSWAQHHQEQPFIQSFALIALGLIFDLLERLGAFLDF